MRARFTASGRDGSARLAYSDCLGPCSEANVVFVYRDGRPLWLRRINSIELFGTLLDWLAEQARGGTQALPPALESRSFTWTGGGQGPAPPVDPER
jgi:hypothetical protein